MASKEEVHEFLRGLSPYESNEFLFAMVERLGEYGELTPRMYEAVGKFIARRAEWAAEREAEAAAAGPFVEGHRTVTGEVKSVKWKYGPYGESLKMLVLEPSGNKVWGTVPKAIKPVGDETDLVGETVSFTATVTKSDRDDHFGFFSRPKNARVVGGRVPRETGYVAALAAAA